MKILKLTIASICVFTIFLACKNNNQPEVKTVDTIENSAKTINPNAKLAKVEFTIEGMTCAMGCAKTIEKKMANLDGVASAKVDFDNKLAMVVYDKNTVNTKLLEETVKKAGKAYSVINMKQVNDFNLKSCDANCKKACCKDAKSTTACANDCKKACCKDAKSKTACSKDCKKDCCKDAKPKTACTKDCKKECCVTKVNA